MNVGEFNGRRLYTGLSLDYRLRLWAPTSELRVISTVAELFVYLLILGAVQLILIFRSRLLRCVFAQ